MLRENVSVAFILRKNFQFNKKDIQDFLKIRESLTLTLDAFLKGEVYSQLPYSIDDIQKIISCLKCIVELQFKDIPSNLLNPSYTLTAGAPGTGKTYYIEKLFSTNPALAVYVDPDQAVMPFMNVYQIDVEKFGQKAAYEKWRDASNFIANFIHVMALHRRCNIVHGTTATNNCMQGILQNTKNLGYQIKLFIFFAASMQRAFATNTSNQESFHIIDQDIVSKAKLFYERMGDAYFIYADKATLLLQTGRYWDGNGETVKFAEFDGADKLIRITRGCEDCLKRVESQMKEALSNEEFAQVFINFRKHDIAIIDTIKPMPQYMFEANRQIAAQLEKERYGSDHQELMTVVPYNSNAPQLQLK